MMKYYIPKSLFEDFKKAVSKLNKRADKLNIENVKYKITNNNALDYKQGYLFPVPCIEVEVYQEKEIIIGGWKFVGFLQRNNKKYIYNGENIPTDIKNITECEHCHTNKRRNKLYVLQNVNDSQYKVVGSSCLKDFTGHMNIERIASLHDDVLALYNSVVPAGYRERQYFPIDLILRLSIASINKFGYRKSCENDSTKETVGKLAYIIVDGAVLRDDEKDEKEILKNAMLIKDEVIEDVKKVILNINQENDYIDNIKILINEQMVKDKMLGYAVSIIPAYNRELKRIEKEKAMKDLKNQSSFIGKEKEKIKIHAKVIKTIILDNFYGGTNPCLYILKDDDNNTIVWKSSKGIISKYNKDFDDDIAVYQDDVVNMIATVKEHKEYREEKQTVVTRAKFLDVMLSDEHLSELKEMYC